MTVEEYLDLVEAVWQESDGDEVRWGDALTGRIGKVHIEAFGHLAPTMFEHTVSYLRKHDERTRMQLRSEAQTAWGPGGQRHVETEWGNLLERDSARRRSLHR